MNSSNTPDPLLAGPELPTFKFELEKSVGQNAWNVHASTPKLQGIPTSGIG